jgi:Flp pilus assembly protein CpaB
MWKRAAVIGGVLAVVAATVAVFTISSDCRHNQMEDDCPEDWQVPGTGHVLVTTQEVQAGQAMDSLIETGGIVEQVLPLDTFVDGAATEASQIEGKTTTRPIGKDEQISLDYLR